MLGKFYGVGRIVNDPQERDTSFGKMASFDLAYKSTKKGENGDYESCYIKVIAYNNTAEAILTYYKKGALVFVEGNLQIRKYIIDGEKKTAVEVVYPSVRILKDPQSNSRNYAPKGTQSGDPYGVGLESAGLAEIDEANDEMPF